MYKWECADYITHWRNKWTDDDAVREKQGGETVCGLIRDRVMDGSRETWSEKTEEWERWRVAKHYYNVCTGTKTYWI